KEAEEAKRCLAATRREPVLPAGSPALYDANQAQKFGLCRLTKKATRQEVAEAYGLPPSSLREDPLQGRDPVPWRIEGKGVLDKALQETLERRISRAVAQKANLIIFQLECWDGDVEVARSLADRIRTLTEDAGKTPVMTVAYVTKQARSNAVFLALGCTEIVMEKDAKLGDSEAFIQQHPQYQKAVADSLEELAREQGYSPQLAR